MTDLPLPEETPVTILVCKNCQATKPAPTGDPTDLHPAEHCGDCPPWRCNNCGQMCSAQSLCRCWVQIAGMPIADMKALFAASGLSIDLEGPR